MIEPKDPDRWGRWVFVAGLIFAIAGVLCTFGRLMQIGVLP